MLSCFALLGLYSLNAQDLKLVNFGGDRYSFTTVIGDDTLHEIKAPDGNARVFKIADSGLVVFGCHQELEFVERKPDFYSKLYHFMQNGVVNAMGKRTDNGLMARKVGYKKCGLFYTNIPKDDAKVLDALFDRILAKSTSTAVNIWNDETRLWSDQEMYRVYYNLATLYYNQSVNLMQESDESEDFTHLDHLQDDCIDLFKRALPYFNQAYQINPSDKDVLAGLEGIMFALNQLEESECYRLEREALK